MLHKQPLGIYPRILWDESHMRPSLAALIHRLGELREAIQRYRDASYGEVHYQIPVGWLLEEIQLARQINDLQPNPC